VLRLSSLTEKIGQLLGASTTMAGSPPRKKVSTAVTQTNGVTSGR
jgi:hypothetical protein